MRAHRPLSIGWVAAVGAVFVVLQFVLLHALTPGGMWSVVYICLLEFFALGVAYDTVSIVLGLWIAPIRVPRLVELPENPPSVALLCTTCDDVDVATFASLKAQDYPRLEIFVLDDSHALRNQALVDTSDLTVMRRNTRRGYKAGNLNHWLRQCGERFDYFVVADADSRLSPDFVTAMVLHAEHPANANVAVFESLITPWNVGNAFGKLQGALCPVHHRIAAGLLSRSGAMLSVGHNNLYRAPAVRAIAGFDERYLAEDYATAIALLEGGWRCVTAPVASQDRVPGNFSEYVRREARWAYQTFQLMSLPTAGLSLACRLRLVMALHHYARSLMLLVAMMLVFATSIWLVTTSDARYGSIPLEGTLLLWLAFVLVPLGMQALAALRLGVSLSTQFAAMVLHQSLVIACAGPVCRRLLISVWRGDRVGFNVTGRTSVPSLGVVFRGAATGVALSWAALLAMVPWHQEPLIALNLLWILPGACAPFLLYWSATEGS